MLVTIVVKTFGRMPLVNAFIEFVYCFVVLTLLSSVRKHYPKIPIMVGDDGRFTVLPENHGKDENLYFLKFPFDIGLSEGRNQLLRNVKSEFVLLMDDDFVFDANSGILSLFSCQLIKAKTLVT
jgi:hypothetical protein